MNKIIIIVIVLSVGSVSLYMSDWRDDEPDIVAPLYYYVYDVPEFAEYDLTILNVKRAFDKWAELNPDLRFGQVQNKDDADIVIDWVKEIKYKHSIQGITKIKTTTIGGSYVYSEISIDVLDYDCNDNVVFWDSNANLDILKHEIGHAIGIVNHSSDENNLMYDSDDGLQNFDNMGYDIPSITSHINHYVNQEKERNQYDQLVNRIMLLETQLKQMEKEYDTKKVEYDVAYEKLRFDDNEYDDVKQLEIEINRLADNMNPIINEYHKLLEQGKIAVSKINCVLNAR